MNEPPEHLPQVANTAESDFQRARRYDPDWGHLHTFGLDQDKLRQAYEAAWNAGHSAGYREGIRDA